MRPRFQLLAAASIASCLVPAAVRGDDFTLSLDPIPGYVMGTAGAPISFSCFAVLGHTGTGSGAGGWSFGIAVEGATVRSATTSGTHGHGFLDPAGSLERIHIIDPLENGGVGGVVSSVVLSTQGLETAVIPPGTGGYSILSLTVDSTIPAGGGMARFEVRDGLIGDGEPFPLSVTQGGAPVTPVVLPVLEVPLQDASDCCDNALSLGFSQALIRDGPIFEGIAGVGEGCFAEGGEIISLAPPGAVNTTTVHVNVISNLPYEGVQGWSFGVAVDGSVVVNSITRAGTAADTLPNGGYTDPEGSIGSNEVIDPAKNRGQKGVVASLALTSQGNPASVLPTVGTETILTISLSAAEPQGETDQIATLRFQEGLIGRALGVDIVMTVNGNTAPICNVDRAGVTVVFREGPEAPFLRGDATADGRFNLTDAMRIFNGLFGGGTQPPCKDASDANDSGWIDISDPVYIMNFLFVSTRSPPPPAPGPGECGPDPTEDALGCMVSNCAET